MPYGVVPEHALVETIEAVADSFRIDYRPLRTGDKIGCSVRARLFCSLQGYAMDCPRCRTPMS
jgi:hypothetical protein